VQLLILYNETQQMVDAVRLLSKSSQHPHKNVLFCPLKLDTIWLRDFGPPFAQLQTGAMSIDCYYDGQRPQDDRLPVTWSELTRAELNSVPWTMHGGNLLGNGQHLAITSNRIFDDNYIRFLSPLPGTNPEIERRRMVVDEFKKYCNLQQLVVLEPLSNESTKHVDMFSVFLKPDLVVVAEMDHRSDPINAQILDRNARLLKSTSFNGQPLRVERIPVPAPVGNSWSAYTNVILANQLLLIPVFDTDNREIVDQAIAVYRRLLPDYEVASIDTSTMKNLQGSIHCMSLNVPEFVPLPPQTISYDRAWQYTQSADKRPTNPVLNQ
jgi:agmatine/peptidylarginine deiminase